MIGARLFVWFGSGRDNTIMKQTKTATRHSTHTKRSAAQRGSTPGARYQDPVQLTSAPSRNRQSATWRGRGRRR